MAEKRRFRVARPPGEESLEDDELPRKYKDVSWTEWLVIDFARYWFVIIALGVDLLIGLDVVTIFSGAGTIAFVLFLAITIPLEILIYLYLWGKNGILMKPR
jgi:membrane protein YqaA with SNARE-associated domain